MRLCVVVDDLEAARRFYGDLLGCALAPAEANGQDVDFFGVRMRLQLLSGSAGAAAPAAALVTDEEGVPAPHVGFDLAWDDWSALVERIRGAGGAFEVEPAVRGVGEPQERAVFVVRDPAGAALVFRAAREVSAAA